MSKQFYNLDDHHLIINETGGFLRAINKGKIYRVFRNKLWLPRTISYFLRKDRFCLLFSDEKGFFYLQNYTVNFFCLQAYRNERIGRLKYTRCIFNDSSVQIGDEIIFFDYNSQGLKYGIMMYTINVKSKTFFQKKIINNQVVQRVISAHYNVFSHSILLSTGDDLNHCKLIEVDLLNQNVTVLMEGDEDLRFMNLFFVSEDELHWFSNNRSFGTKLIVYSHKENRIIERRELGKKINVWHTRRLNDGYLLGETLEPVKFEKNQKNISIYKYNGNDLLVLKQFQIKLFFKFFRFPSIEFISSAGPSLFFKVDGSRDDGTFSFIGGNVKKINYLKFCLELGEREFKVWNLSSRNTIKFWKQLSSRNEILKSLESQPQEIRVRNLVLKLLDKLKYW